MDRHVPRTTLFPYTTLFRSRGSASNRGSGAERAGRESSACIQADRGGRSVERREALAQGVTRQLCDIVQVQLAHDVAPVDRKSTRLNSSHVEISYAVFCLKK